MSRAPRSDEPAAWRPTAKLEVLRRRAALLAQVRSFFRDRGVLEVETPALAAAAVTDLHLDSLTCRSAERELFLQTSPEFAMKRLLAAGSGPIFQLCRAFRDGERGRLHNPEFTILEWYRPGFDHHALMDEMDDFLGRTLGTPAAVRTTYGALFSDHLGVDPHRDPIRRLRQVAREHGLDVAGLDVAGLEADDGARDDWLHVLLTHLIEPRLAAGPPTFVYDYPVSQAALARVADGVAERFEVYAGGVELANGFHELTDAAEQRRRFADDLRKRRAAGRPVVPVDERFLAALSQGLPACAGVALGFDRLVMLAVGVRDIAEVVAFPIERA